ncbi:MAG: hypothetical protein KGS72_11970 [Cyanobacteria bacterium REEB67]|nr:hypothetical protein [Cyanobacteria bacterium REEB67]
MQFNLRLVPVSLQRSASRKSLFSLLAISALLLASSNAAEAASTKKKSTHPKGFVHDTAGDGVATAVASYGKGGTPKWIQYDWGGLYYYNRNEPEKARAYWMQALKEAEVAVPAERARNLSPRSAIACCELIRHLTYLVADTKFRPTPKTNTAANPSDGSAAASLAKLKAELKQSDSDWDWYERICNFATRAIGRQRDCMRAVYNQRTMLERQIVQNRQSAQRLEESMGIDKAHSQIDTRPLKWDGIPGGGNPFDRPNSNPTPVELRGGATPDPRP